MPPPRAVWPLLLGLVLAAGLAARWKASRGPLLFDRPDYVVLADNLVSHRLLGEDERPGAFRGVLFPAAIALTRESWFPLSLPFPRWQALLSAAAIPGAALLGLLAHSPLAGLLAAVLVACDPGLIGAAPSYHIEPFLGLLVLAVCLALLLWKQRPGAAGAGLAGACVGLSLLCRSTLFLLPPFLLLAASLVPALKGLRRGRTAFLAASYLLLAPWAARNAWHFRAFIPLEQGAASRNLYAASLGYVENVEGYGYQDVLAGRLDTDPLASSGPVDRMRDMALEHIRRQPLAYARSTAKRFVLSLRLRWWAWVLAALLLFWRRREADAALLGAVALYFFAVHSPMTWEARYFDPVLPALYALAGGALAEAWSRARGRRPAAPKAAPAWLRPALASACAALLSLGLGYLAAEAAWLKAPCRLPESRLSSLRCGQARLAGGDAAGARKAWERAWSLAQEDRDVDARLLVAQGLLDGRRELLDQAVAASSPTVRAQAIDLQERRRFPEAARLMDALVTRDARSADALTVRGAQRALAGEAAFALRDLQRAVALAPDDVAARVNLGALLESQGRCSEALAQYRRAAAAAENLPESKIPGFYLALARLYRDRLEAGRGPDACRR
jgi:4-amino-4-deoxy-L-arabinose transferase-like glycosyltransferase